MLWLVSRLLASLAGVALVTLVAYKLIPANATTVGFAYLLLVLLIASTWGFVESAFASIAATFTYNFFFLPPIGALTIADPENWIALFSFMTTSLVASRLSDKAKRRALDAIERRQDVERLYTFSRAILLIDTSEPFAKQMMMKAAEIFDLSAAVLFERATQEFYRAGPADFEGLDEKLRDAALHGTSFFDPQHNSVIMAVHLGSRPIAGLALQGPTMPDSVLQGIANLIAIGLERARAEDLALQIEAATQSEQLRTTLIDAMAHELKTPLTSIRAATTSLLDAPNQPAENRMELVRIADEEAERLQNLIENTIEMARLDTTKIDIHPERSNVIEIVQSVISSMQKEIDVRQVDVTLEGEQPAIPADQRLIRLAIKQLLDNALKYSSPGTPVTINVRNHDDAMIVDVTNRGKGISLSEQARVFERFWRSPSVKHRMPGSGLGLSIAHRIAQAHNGDLTVTSRPGETTFRLTLPIAPQGE